MIGGLDYQDMKDGLSLSLPGNRDIAATFLYQKVIDLANRFPEIRKDPFSSRIIDLCVSGLYYPLDQVEIFEDLAYESRAELEINCPDLYDTITKGAVAMRDEYIHLVAASRILAEKWGKDHLEALLDPIGRDKIARLAFYDTDRSTGREKFEACLEKLFFNYKLLMMIDPARGNFCSRNGQWQVLQDIMDVMPAKQIDTLLEKSCLFAQLEAYRLYGGE